MIGDKPSSGKKIKAQVDLVFLRQLRQLIGVIFPNGFFSAETGYMVLVAVSLIARSVCDIWMIQNGTLVETAIINMDKQLFYSRLLFFFSGMPLVSHSLWHLGNLCQPNSLHTLGLVSCWQG